MSDVRRWQDRLAAWRGDRFGPPSLPLIALKLAEETGEVCEAILKPTEGHPDADRMDLGWELADVVAVALAAADVAGYDMDAELVRRTNAYPDWPGEPSSDRDLLEAVAAAARKAVQPVCDVCADSAWCGGPWCDCQCHDARTLAHMDLVDAVRALDASDQTQEAS